MICTVHTTSCCELNQHTPTLIIVLYIIIFIYTHHHDKPTIDFNSSILNTHHRFSVTSRIVLKILTFKASSGIITQSPRCIYFVPSPSPSTKKNPGPLIVSHDYIQPIEIPILEFIHNTKYNHKIYNLIQNTPHEFAVGTEELKTTKALQLLWPLLQTKNTMFSLMASFPKFKVSMNLII